MLGTNQFANSTGYGSEFRNPNNALQGLLTNSTLEPVFLVEMTAGETLNIWTDVSGNIYQTTLTEQFVNTVIINGAECLEDVNLSGNNRYYYNMSTNVLQINTNVNPNLISQYVQVIYSFYISDTGIIKNGIYYDPYVSSLPALSLRLDVTFGSIAQISGGALELLNETAIWDLRSTYNWQAGTVNILMGTVDLPYEEYVQIGSWSIDYFQRTTEKFTLNLIDKKTNIDVQIPYNVYSQAQYPNLRIDDAGSPIPWAYGTIYGAQAVCTDTTSGTFTLASHPITAINQIRVLNNQAWTVVYPSSVNLSGATFNLASGDWSIANNQNVSVDLYGKPNANGFIMNNGADIVTDIFSQMGLNNLDYNSFNNSWDALDLGYQNFNPLERASQRTPSVYLYASGSAVDVFQQINSVTNAYLFMDGIGNFRYKVFEPVQQFPLLEIHDEDILTFEMDSATGLKTSQVIVNYSERIADQYNETVTIINSGNQWLNNQAQPVTVIQDQTPLSDLSDATYYGQQIMFENQFPLIEYMIDVKWKPWILNPGDFVHLVYSLHNIDLVLEVSEINYNLTNRTCSLTLTTMHGLSGRQGFWVENNTNYDWDNTNSPWTKTQKQQNSGHWHTDNYIATSGTNPSGIDYNVSVWA